MPVRLTSLPQLIQEPGRDQRHPGFYLWLMNAGTQVNAFQRRLPRGAEIPQTPPGIRQAGKA